MKASHIISIIFFGSLWGLVEATAGGALHFANVPFTGTMMASIGFAILFTAMRAGLSAYQLPIVALVAASFKFLDCFAFGLPIAHVTVINPATAIASQGLAFMFAFRWMKKADSVLSLAPAFLGVAAISIIMFNATSTYIYNWPTFHLQDISGTALVHLPMIAVLSTLFTKLISLVRFELGAMESRYIQVASAIAFTALTVTVKMI